MRKFARVFRPDRRDAQFAVSPRRTNRRFRYWHSPRVNDQGSRPSCVGHAWCHWLATSPRPAHLQGDYLYQLCKFQDEWEGENYDGTSVRAGAKICHGVGILSAYQWARSKDALVYTLLEQGPVVVGTNWYAGMDRPDASGLITSSGRVRGGHAYLADGANIDVGLARVKNSWGKGWGEAGRAWITIDDLWQLIKDQGEACLGLKANVRRARTLPANT